MSKNASNFEFPPHKLINWSDTPPHKPLTRPLRAHTHPLEIADWLRVPTIANQITGIYQPN